MTIFETSTLAALIALVAAAFAVYFRSLLGQLPHAIAKFLITKCTTKIVLRSDSGERPYYDAWKLWLTKHVKTKKNPDIYFMGDGKDEFFMVPMDTNIWVSWHGIMLCQWLPIVYGKDLHHYEFHTYILGKDPRKLAQLKAEIKALIPEVKNEIEVSTWTGENNWQTEDKPGRDFDTIYMPTKDKNLIIHSIEEFIKNKEWYNNKGVPHRVGMLFVGPAGVGKTSVSKALAAKFQKRIYLMNLGQFQSDTMLLKAFTCIAEDSIILIEDIDTFNVARRRENVADETKLTSKQLKKALEATTNKLSLSAVLNSIDGFSAKEGCILILSSNDPSSLDPALVRKGRIDLTIEFGHLPAENVVDMFKVFFPSNLDLIPKLLDFAKDLTHTASWWQSLFILNKNNPEDIFKGA